MISLPRNISIALVVLALGIANGAVLAQSAVDSAFIDVQNARLRNGLNGLELYADANIQLSPEIRRGLDSGVPLQFIVDFRIKQPRQFWRDKTVLEIEHRYSLIYYELTRHYRLQSLENNETRNFRSLLAALDELGRLQGLAVNPSFELEARPGLVGYVSMRLDSKALPLPLQPLVSSAWRLTSEDFAWSLN